MNIINLTRLIGGELLSNPQISSVENFTFSVKNVVNKSAFIALDADSDDVSKAIEKGAYAIIFDSEFEIISDEIAYIKVANLNYAMFCVMRFYVNLRRHKFVFLSEIQRSIISCLHLDGRVMMMPGEVKKLFSTILHAKENTIFFGSDRDLMEKISPVFGKIKAEDGSGVLYDGSIFYSSFVYGEIYYQNLNFPRIFIDEIYSIMRFLREFDIDFRIGDFKNLGHFEPIFVDKFFNITQHGASYRAFIIESDEALFIKAATFLRQNFSAGIKVCLPQNANFTIDGAIFYSLETELKNIGDFHYALVYGSKESIVDMLNQKPKTLSIFD